MAEQASVAPESGRAVPALRLGALNVPPAEGGSDARPLDSARTPRRIPLSEAVRSLAATPRPSRNPDEPYVTPEASVSTCVGGALRCLGRGRGTGH